jgi:Carboxypeptidase regulatory-like domain/TonB dependent receptor
MSVSRILSRSIITFALMLVAVIGARAQYRAGISGTVVDPQGAVVSDAKVTITAKETGLTQEGSTDANGVYSITRLAPGLYTITVEKAGFKRKVLDDFTVIAEQMNAVNVTLDIGEVTESVTVNGNELPAIDTESGVIAGTVTSQQIQALPSFGRDVFQLVQLAPGAFGDASRNAGGDSFAQPGNAGPGGSGGGSGVFSTENRPQVTINGGRQDSNNVTLDGINITSVSWGAAAIITPNEDSVKEVRVVTNEYDAESGRFGSGQIQVISQSGTNSYHGSAFFKADRPGLNAYQPFYGSADAPRTPERNENRFNQWGGSIGGPVIKNKLFVFFAYETIRNNGTNVSSGWFETAALLNSAPAGSLAARYGAFPGEAVSSTSVVDQTCASIGLVQGTNCNAIPGQGLDIGRPLNTALFPLGTKDPSFVNNLNPGLGGDGTGSPANLDGIADIAYVNTTGPNDQTNQQFNGRIDFNATSKDLFAYNIYYVPVSNTTFNNPRPANIFFHNAINEAMTGLWTHTFTPTLINEARINAAGWRWNELADNPQSPLGLPNPAYIGDPNNGNNIGTINAQGNTLGGAAGSIFDQWTYGAKDVVTKIQGSHTLKFGGEITKLHFVQDAPWSARPNWGFQNYWDFLNDAAFSETGVFNPTNGIPTDVRKDSRQTFYGFFAQDSFKAKPNLTITAGLRWDYFGPISFTRNQLSTAVLGAQPNPLTGLYMRIGGNLYNSQAGNFGPQLGFAWSPGSVLHREMNSKLVIRGGFGIGYTAPEQAITLNGWPNIPFTNNGIFLTGSNVVYDFPSDPHQFGPFPANPNTIAAFNQNNIPIGGSPVGVTAFPSHLPTTYTYRYSLEGQYDLGHNWVATVGYQGSTSHHLTRQSNLNLIYGAEGIALNPQINNVDYYSYDANSNFNALLTELQHRFARSFEIDAQYRFSKSMDNASGPYEVNYYQWNPKLDWGPSDFDATHAFKLWGIYTPSFFKQGWEKKVLGGWSISGIFNWHSGYPWSPYFNSTCNLIYANGACTNGGGNGQLAAAAYAGGAQGDYSNSAFLRHGGNFPNGGATYFTTPTFTNCAAAFPAVCPGAPQTPGIQRNNFRGPRYRDVDATISKAFGLPRIPILGENAQFEFRANAYNLFNNLNLDVGQIDKVITDPAFGEITGTPGALGGRTIELQARFSF